MDKITCISPSKDVFFNLAAEEYLLKHLNTEVAFFYCDEPCVVVGKHQNAMAESNYPYLVRQNIPLARRMSGGGTVFHDLGNANFSFIKPFTEHQKSVAFKTFLDPLLHCLRNLGVPATYSDRNDLLVEGKKFSGNAEHVFQQGKKTLHHGTILLNSDLLNLGKAISNKKSYAGKAVQSVRSEVANIGAYLEPELNMSEFLTTLSQFYVEQGYQPYTFSKNDILVIETLRKEKYSTWDWNIGYSPKYSLAHEFVLSGCFYKLSVEIGKGGIVNEIVLAKDNEEFGWVKTMLNQRLEWSAFQRLCIEHVSDSVLANQICNSFF